MKRIAVGALVILAFDAAETFASSVEVGMANANGGEFAARVALASTCNSDIHQVIVSDVVGGNFSGCSSLAAEAELASGATTFTAGDRVILRNGFRVADGASLTVEIDRELYPDAWVQDDTPDGETVYSARFFIDPSGLILSAESEFYHFLAYDAGNKPELRVGVKFNSGVGENRLFLEVFQDNGSIQTTEGSNELLLPVGWHWVDVIWQAGSGDGVAALCVDQVAPPAGCVVLSSLDNDTGAIDFVRWGAVDVPSNSDLGMLDMDDFTSAPLDDGFESGSTSAWSDAYLGQP